MVPKFSFKSKKKADNTDKAADQRGTLEKSGSQGTEKNPRATLESLDDSQSSRKKLLVERVTSRRDSFTLPQASEDHPAPDTTTGTAFALHTPRRAETATPRKMTLANNRQAHPHRERSVWKSADQGVTANLAPVEFDPLDLSLRQPLSPRTALTSRRENASEVLQRLTQEGRIRLIQLDTGETVFVLHEKIDPDDLWKACNGVPLDNPLDFAKACYLLEAALPLIQNDSQRQQLLERLTPAVVEYGPGNPPLGCLTLGQAIAPYTHQALKARVTAAVEQQMAVIEKLEQQSEPKRSKGQAVLAELHTLLQAALDLQEPTLARQIVAAAQRVPLLFQASHRKKATENADEAPPDLGTLHGAADALYGTWQQAVLANPDSASLTTLFAAPTDPLLSGTPLPLVQMHGVGPQARISFNGPIDAKAIDAVIQVCRTWWGTAWAAEADVLLEAVLGTVKDPAHLGRLTQGLGAALLRRSRDADGASVLPIVAWLARLHRRSPLSNKQFKTLIDRLTVCFKDFRYDFDSMRALNAVAQSLGQALDAKAGEQPGAVPLASHRRFTELATACRDALGPLQQFKERWDLAKDEHGAVHKLSYKPGRVRGNALALQQEEAWLVEREKELGLQENGPMRPTLFKLYDKPPADLKDQEKRLMANALELHNRQHAHWQQTEDRGGNLAYERSMFIADINRFLQDPKGPPWTEVKRAIQTACTALNWAPSAQQWLSWTLLAARPEEGDLLDKRIRQTQAEIAGRLKQEHKDANPDTLAQWAQAETRRLLFTSLQDLMDQHVPWETVQAALATVHMASEWQLDDSQRATLCLAQALRGDPQPLTLLLSEKHAAHLPASELDTLLSLLDQPNLPPQWETLRDLAKPLFAQAPKAQREAYDRLAGSHRSAMPQLPSLPQTPATTGI